jgi:glyoxylase-like metal-dependent hydrolase (beta-lactamase superfamily II)
MFLHTWCFFSYPGYRHTMPRTGTGALKALYPDSQSVLSAASTGKADVLLQPYDTVTFGTYTLRGLPTPGHTAVSVKSDGCMTAALWCVSL